MKSIYNTQTKKVEEQPEMKEPVKSNFTFGNEFDEEDYNCHVMLYQKHIASLMKDKNIKDFLHLYIGCDVVIRDFATAKLIGVREDHFYVQGKPHNHFYINKGVKPILRNLSDMTEEEMIEMENIINKYEEDFQITDDMRKAAWEKIKKDGIKGIRFDESNNPLMVFQITRFFLSKHFDLFGLIEAGLAIDKYKI